MLKYSGKDTSIIISYYDTFSDISDFLRFHPASSGENHQILFKNID